MRPTQSTARASIHHSTIAPSQVWIANMSKTNPGGTILNNEPLREGERRELNNNDIVQVCRRAFLFSCGAPRATRTYEAGGGGSVERHGGGRGGASK